MNQPSIPRCPCEGDAAATADVLRRGRVVATLIDESHFIVTLRACRGCARAYLSVFCERVDWTDGDDPQSRVFIPLSAEEASSLSWRAGSCTEAELLALPGERLVLVHDIPKARPATYEWRRGPVFIPAHD